MTSSVSLLAAFLAGLFSFVSPCVLPIVPGYLSFISGVNVAQWKGDAAPSELVRRVALASLAFVLGFSTVFVALGAAATLVGALLLEHKRTLGMIGGVIIVVLGLHTMGVFKIQWLLGEKRASVTSRPLGLVGAYVVGLAFAFGWTPCIGPVLGAILAVAAGEDSVRQGVSLLFVYSLGLGIPFVVAAIAIRPFLSTMQRFKRHLATVEKVLGGFLVLTGILFLTDAMTLISSWMLELFPGLATIG